MRNRCNRVIDLAQRARAKQLSEVLSQVTVVQGDIADAAAVDDAMRAHDIDTIVNFAAESHVDRSILGPDAFIATNIVGTFELLEAARSLVARKDGPGRDEFRFVHVSTDEVFGSLGAEIGRSSAVALPRIEKFLATHPAVEMDAEQLGFGAISSVSRATLPGRVLNLALVASLGDATGKRRTFGHDPAIFGLGEGHVVKNPFRIRSASISAIS